MNKLEQLHLFLRFHYAPDSEQKREVWSLCCKNGYNDAVVAEVCANIILGDHVLSDDEVQYLRIVTDPPAFATRDVEFATKLAELVATYKADPDVAHSTADEFLCSVLDGLGYINLVQTYRTAPKRYV